MSEKNVTNQEQIKPMRLTDNQSGAVYELDFNRDSVRFAEGREFVLEDVRKFPNTKIEELFYYAFRKNHRKLSRSQTDEILKRKHGLTGPELERLLQLYTQAALTYVIAEDEDEGKNSEFAVEL